MPILYFMTILLVVLGVLDGGILSITVLGSKMIKVVHTVVKTEHLAMFALMLFTVVIVIFMWLYYIYTHTQFDPIAVIIGLVIVIAENKVGD